MNKRDRMHVLTASDVSLFGCTNVDRSIFKVKLNFEFDLLSTIDSARIYILLLDVINTPKGQRGSNLG